MKAEYDFSKGTRGKFYHANAIFNLPVYLEPDVNEFMNKLVEERGSDVQTLVNEWLRANIQVLQGIPQAH
ncbi:MAG: hypothetical protein GY796_27455 [Chloroflexi bacterium]|nr:hypothetical protein [Chloroflexota bacterium]